MILYWKNSCNCANFLLFIFDLMWIFIYGQFNFMEKLCLVYNKLHIVDATIDIRKSLWLSFLENSLCPKISSSVCFFSLHI